MKIIYGRFIAIWLLAEWTPKQTQLKLSGDFLAKVRVNITAANRFAAKAGPSLSISPIAAT